MEDNEPRRTISAAPPGGGPGIARATVERVQATRAWRWVGRHWVLPEVRVVAALEDPRERWRHVYPDFDKRPDRGRRALSGAWIAVWGRRGLGGTLLHPFEEGLFLSAMRVRPWCRRWGVAGKLVVRAQSVSKERGSAIWLVVAADNEPAIRLYRSYGFRRTEPPAVVAQDGHVGMRWDPEE